MEHLQDVIKALQNLLDNQKAIIEVGETKGKVEAELKASQKELDRVKEELKNETAGLTAAEAAVRRNYDIQLNEASTRLADLQKRIAESTSKLTELDAQVRDKQGQHDAVVRGLNALRDRIEGRAA